MGFLTGGLGYIVPFLIVLTILVFVHELGHYLIARWNKVRVEVFSIGFGRELFGWTDRTGTRWKISTLPLGGYVKMFGEGDIIPTADADARELSPSERDVSFKHKRLPQRAAVVVAGPAANFIFCHRRLRPGVRDGGPKCHAADCRPDHAGLGGSLCRAQARR